LHDDLVSQAFGHNKVSVLDGGFKAWKSAGYPIEKGEAKIEVVSKAISISQCMSRELWNLD